MKVNRSFKPQSNTELITDYAYLIYEGDMQTATRKQLKIKLFSNYIPRVYAESLPFLLMEAKSQVLRSIFIIHSIETKITQQDLDMFKNFDYMLITDEEMQLLLNSIQDNEQKTNQEFAKNLVYLNEIYQHRVKLRQAQLANSFFEIQLLNNYLKPQSSGDQQEGDDVNNQLMPDIVSMLNAQQDVLIAEQDQCIKNTFFQNIITTIKQQISLFNQQQFAFQQSTVQVNLQDFDGRFFHKPLETLDIKIPINCSHPLQIMQAYLLPPQGSNSNQQKGNKTDQIKQYQMLYDVIQLQFPLCDDPTKTWFYVNDTRVSYTHPLDSVPYGRLLINGNSLKQPSCVLQDKNLTDCAEDLVTQYQHFETVFAKACHALAQLFVSATKHSKRALVIISDEIKHIKSGTADLSKLDIRSTDFDMNAIKTPEEIIQDQVEDFIVQNSAVLQSLTYDPKQVPQLWSEYEKIKDKDNDQLTQQQKVIKALVEKLQIPDTNMDKTRNWIIDFDEMFLVNRKCTYQSPVSLYTQEPSCYYPNQEAQSNDVIVIRPKFSTHQQNFSLYVHKTGRNRTTYETVSLLAQYLSLVGQIDPLPKRSYTHVLIFNEKLNLKNIFIPLEITDAAINEYNQQYGGQFGDIRIQNANDVAFNRIFYELVVQKLKQITSRDKFAKTKVTEDYNAGECNVCNTRYDNYKVHIQTNDHIRNFKAFLMQGENMMMSLVRHQNNFELIQSINTQFNAMACTLATENNCTWHQACTAINSAIKDIGGQYQLDPEDVPRANSTSCKTNNFARWREDVCLRRQGVLESVLTSASARKSGYKRIKQSAATMAIVVFSMEKNRQLCFKRSLERIFLQHLGYQEQFAAGIDENYTGNQGDKHKEHQHIKEELQYKKLKMSCMSDFLYYKYPEYEPSQESLIARLVLDNEPRFGFHEQGYGKLLEVAYITLLVRACQGTSLVTPGNLDDSVLEKHSRMPEETLIQDDVYLQQVMNKLSDTYPQINGDIYQERIQELQERRNAYYKQQTFLKANFPLDVLNLQLKELRAELTDIELGYLPKTDCIIQLAKVIRQIEYGKKVSINDLLSEAINQFNSQNMKSLNKNLTQFIKQFIQNKQIIPDLYDQLADLNDKTGDFTELHFDESRSVKLPYMDVYQPECTQNKHLYDALRNCQNGEISQNQLNQITTAAQACINVESSENATKAQQLIKMLSSAPRDLIQNIVIHSCEKLNIPLFGGLFDENSLFLGQNALQEHIYVNSHTHFEAMVPEEPCRDDIYEQRSQSCYARVSGLKRRHVVARSNSVGHNFSDMDSACVSVQLLHDIYEPILTQKTQQATFGSSENTAAFLSDATLCRAYERAAQANADARAPQDLQRVVIKGKPQIVSPILSTSLTEHFFRAHLTQLDMRKIRTPQQLATFRDFYLALTKHQLDAAYGALSVVFGGFSAYIQLSTEFWKASADVLLGTSASVSSVISEVPAYGLKTTDIASCTLVALLARERLLGFRASHGISEREAEIQSKSIARHVPPRALVSEEALARAFQCIDNDIIVQKNTEINGCGLDLLIGGIYGQNGIENQ